MGELVQAHIPCPCGKSSDAYCVYDDGWGHCFSCGENHKEGSDTPIPQKRKRVAQDLIPFGEFVPLKARNLREETCRKFGYFVADINGRRGQVAPYHNDAGEVVAQKVRFADKTFMVTGDLSEAGLFGAHLARSGGKRIVITEGEIDAMSVSQAMNLTWPAVSVPNGAKGAFKALQANLEWLEAYEQVVLMFDMDEPGKEAAAECAELFSPGKCLIASLPRKDANEMLQHNEVKQLVTAVWEAKTYRPDGIVNSEDTWEMAREEVEFGKPYPWAGLNKILYGRREAEVVTWCAGTGIGKSAIVAEIAYAITQSETEPVGYIALEEPVKRSVKRFMGIHLNKPIHLPGNSVSDKDLRKAWEETLGSGKVRFYDSFGSLHPEVLLSKMRFLVKSAGCRTIILDHLSIMISGLETENERKDIDVAMTAIRSFAQETGANIQLISHLKRRDGTTHEDGGQISLSHLRGSQAIAQLSDAVIGAERDQQETDPLLKNTTMLRVLKNRYSGETGVCAALRYDGKTGRLAEVPFTINDEGEYEFGERKGPAEPNADDDVPF